MYMGRYPIGAQKQWNCNLTYWNGWSVGYILNHKRDFGFVRCRSERVFLKKDFGFFPLPSLLTVSGEPED